MLHHEARIRPKDKLLINNLNQRIKNDDFSSDIFFKPQPKTPKAKKEVIKTIKKTVIKKKLPKKRLYGSVRQIVVDRDNKICQLCKKREGTEAHHIIYKSQDRTLINTPSNLILLCNDCHKLVHKNKRKYKPILSEMMKER